MAKKIAICISLKIMTCSQTHGEHYQAIFSNAVVLKPLHQENIWLSKYHHYDQH